MAATGEGPYVARFRRRFSSEDETSRYVSALYDVFASTIGSDKLVLRAGKMNALKMMRSHALPDRICALARLVFEDPTLERVSGRANTRRVIGEIEERLADLIAQRNVEDSIEQKINAKMVARHQDYLNDLKMEALREDGGPETQATQKKLEELRHLGGRGLSASALQLLRPQALKEVVGQETAIRSLLAKISSPYPQHVILYGPPGVGKTTVARLALEVAKSRTYTPFPKDAPFVEASGTTLRWDPRETTNPLLGSVHDPIYQGTRREFAESGIPEPKLGLVTRAHGGVLFIDEIGEMDPLLQTKLLKVLEDKKVVFESSYYDESAPNVPEYIKRLFREGAPADFILIGATTREPEDIDPAIRSRCAAVYFEPLTQHQIVSIVNGALRRLRAKAARGVAPLIASYTIEGRKAVQIVADAYGHALYRLQAPRKGKGGNVSPAGETPGVTIAEDDVREVVQSGRLVQHTIVKGRAAREVGKTFGLGVLHYLGSIIEIEAVAFAAASAGKGGVRFNDAAGSMAKDSVFNAAAVVRAVTSLDTANYDLHINVIGGGNIDGPSAGLAIFLALYSAMTKTALPQDVAITGELSIQGKVRPVGGIVEKLYAARQAGMRAIFVPKENMREIDRSLAGIDVIPVASVEQAFRALSLHKKSTRRPTRSRRSTAPRP
jgi:ATP-dependent Lon protease